jgi:multidrug efflux pump subunit AcrA (membrane-fusion protein)
MDNETPRQVQLRQDLQQSRQQHQGKTYLVVKDPVSRRYFRFTETQAAILDLLAVPTDAETVAATASQKFGTVSPATIQAFLASLESKDLLDTPAVRERLGTSGTASKLQQSSILYKQVLSLNPEQIFDWLLPRTRWAFTPAFQALGCLLILSGVSIFFLHWDELRAQTPSLLSIWTILMVWPIVFTVSAYHEFSHGLTCRHFGGQVKEVGFMLIYFSPAFYCDVSDAWMFPRRRDRMLVTLAGGYSQLMLWGLCTIIWRITEPDTYINQIMVVVVVFSGLQTLFNFNPLIKLDGYYMLSDYLEVPNLRAKGFATVWNWITRNTNRKTFREERAQLVYGLCAIAFSSTLLLLVYSRIYTWATTNWSTAGLVGFAVFSTITLRRTAAESMSGLKALVSHASAKRVRNAVILLVAISLSIFVRWELKIPAQFKVLPKGEWMVRAQTEGLVTEVLAREGVRVHKNDLLARTRDYEKVNELERITGELNESKRKLETLNAPPRPEEITQIESRIATKNIELQNKRRNQQERSQLQEALAQKKTRLKQLEIEATAKKEEFEAGLIGRILYDAAQNAVEVQQHDILEAEAAIRTLDERADRDVDLITKQLAELESDLRYLKAGNRPELIRETQAQVEKLETLVGSLKQEIEKSDILAPIDGTVVTPFPERKLNQKLAVGDEFVRLVDTEGVMVEMMVPEKDLEDVKAGSRVTLTARSLPDQEFEGRVDFIAPIAQTSGGQQMIAVRTQLPNDSSLLRPEMSGVARIYCGKRRVIDLLTRRMRNWVKTEFLNLLP